MPDPEALVQTLSSLADDANKVVSSPTGPLPPVAGLTEAVRRGKQGLGWLGQTGPPFQQISQAVNYMVPDTPVGMAAEAVNPFPPGTGRAASKIAEGLSSTLPFITRDKVKGSKLVKSFEELTKAKGDEAALAIISNQVRPAVRVRDPARAKALGLKPGETMPGLARHQTDIPEDAFAETMRNISDKVGPESHPEIGARIAERTGADPHSGFSSGGTIRGWEFGGEFYDQDAMNYVTTNYGLPRESTAVANTGAYEGFIETEAARSRLNRQATKYIEHNVAAEEAIEKSWKLYARDDIAKRFGGGPPFLRKPHTPRGKPGLPPNNIPYLVVRAAKPNDKAKTYVLFGKSHGSALTDNQLVPGNPETAFDMVDYDLLESGIMQNGKLVAK